ncbi:MAG: carboxypeptidase-like regulatory domain-containing protein [Paludibacter sp.]
MRKLSLVFFVSMLTTLSLLAQTSATGTVKDADSGKPLSGVIITFLKQNISTQTNANGEFKLSFLQSGDEELSISRQGYFTQIKLVNLKSNVVNDFGEFGLKTDVQDEVKQESVLQLSETELSSDENNTQNVSASLSSIGDIYLVANQFFISVQCGLT